MRALPPLAVLLGAAGVIPFAILGILSVATDSDASLRAVHALVGYGAVILAFLGGVHWGFTLAEPDQPRFVRARLALGVIPSLLGWTALMLNLFFVPLLGLLLLIAGFIGTLLVESRAQKRDLMPAGYLAMRWVITLLVVALLTTVAVLRGAGAHVLL
jgi:hypothetical protein